MEWLSALASDLSLPWQHRLSRLRGNDWILLQLDCGSRQTGESGRMRGKWGGREKESRKQQQHGEFSPERLSWPGKTLDVSLFSLYPLFPLYILFPLPCSVNPQQFHLTFFFFRLLPFNRGIAFPATCCGTWPQQRACLCVYQSHLFVTRLRPIHTA